MNYQRRFVVKRALTQMPMVKTRGMGLQPDGHMGDLSSWWNSVVDSVTGAYNATVQWAGDATSTAEQYYTQAQDWISNGESYVVGKYNDLVDMMNQITSNDTEIQAAYNQMPEGSDKTRIEAMITSTQGDFTNYVQPLWNYLQNQNATDTNESTQGTVDPTSTDTSSYLPDTLSSGQFGQEPITTFTLAIAAVAALIAVSYYAYNHIQLQNAILNDPSVREIYLKNVAQDQGTFAYIAAATGNLKWPIIISALAVVGYYVFKNSEKISKGYEKLKSDTKSGYHEAKSLMRK